MVCSESARPAEYRSDGSDTTMMRKGKKQVNLKP